MYRFTLYYFVVFFTALTVLPAMITAKAYSQFNVLPAFHIVTSEYAPFNYLKDNRPTGFCTEIVQEILKDLHIDVPIRTLPWVRAYKKAIEQENTLIYTIARTPKREALFHWAGILVESKTYLFSMKKRVIKLDSLDEARQYRIGATRGDLRAKYLISKGFLDLDLVVNTEMNAVKLIKNRIDLWAEDEIAAIYTVRRLGHHPETVLSKSLHLKMENTPKGYLAFSLNTNLELVEAFSKTLEKLKLDKRYDSIRRKYIYITP
jgi:polar amino acid transport system substrate-binding protein